MEHMSDEEIMGIPERHISQVEPPTELMSRGSSPSPTPENTSGSEDSDEGDLQDPQDTLKTSCRETSSCSSLLDELEVCNDRVNSREKTLETCEQELYDFVSCVDSCVAEQLFKLLK